MDDGLFSDDPQKVLASVFGRLRHWTYWVTLTTSPRQVGSIPYSGDADDAYRKALLSWAKSIQRSVGGDFEYLFIPENGEIYESLTHLHGLVYLSRGSSSEIRDRMRDSWKYGSITHVRSCQRIRSRVVIANYMLKDFTFNPRDGKLHRPIFSSPSLRNEIIELGEAHRANRTRSQRNATRRQQHREAAFFTKGMKTDDERLAELRCLAKQWGIAFRKQRSRWIVGPDICKSIEEMTSTIVDEINRSAMSPWEYNEHLRKLRIDNPFYLRHRVNIDDTPQC